MTMQQIINWIDRKKQTIIDPNNEGIQEKVILDLNILSDKDKTRLSLLYELEDFINLETKFENNIINEEE
jgi:hypothetical protein